MIDQSDLALLDMRYKKIEDCDKEMKTATTEYHDLDKRLAVIEQRMTINNWLTLAIVGGIITLLIKVFLGG